MNNHRCFSYMKELGNHDAICTECGYEFKSYKKWVDSNLKEHRKNNPNCNDCKEKEDLK